METRKRGSGRLGRLGALFLAAALSCALFSGTALAAPAEGASALLNSAAPKPQVTIQGNVVVDKGKPTGFYELALCVRTARTVTLKADGSLVDDAVYAAELAQVLADGNKPEDRAALEAKYDVRNYPFQSAAAAVTVNLDALTAVTWGAGKPVYDSWSAAGTGSTSGSYTDDAGRDTHYPRGIDKDGEDQAKIFTDLDPVLNNTSGKKVRVRLDTAKPDEVNNATAFIEEGTFGAAATDRTGLLTLSANTTTTANVVYETSTPVVVVRFAYDMNRFTDLEVGVGEPGQPDYEPNTSNFWLGLNKDDNDPGDAELPQNSGKTPLTYLGAWTDAASLTAADKQVAGSSVFQSVLYTQNLENDGVTDAPTRFYYYLGAGKNTSYNVSGQGNVVIHDEATDNDDEATLWLPNTLGSAIVADYNAAWATPGDPDAPGGVNANGNYSFFQNLLTLRENTLRLTLVNAETYRKPTGGVGGAQILFYDWDDTLIGALVVDPEGDARPLVNEYVEKTFIHPRLRTGEIVAGAKDLADLQTKPEYADYQNRVNSLAREHTYRGDYAYTVGHDNDDAMKFGPDSAEPGEDYPLTDKLDYAFYRRVTTQKEVTDPGTGLTTRYYTVDPVETGPAPVDPEEEYDGYLYPYVYGWAIVEDESQDLTKKNWILHKDSIKTEDVWTTFGVGELGDLDPAAAATQTIPGTAEPYTYAVTEQDAAWYLRFADFSAMEKMLRPGQDVLIVKAVYEPGESLLEDYNYTVVDESLHIERYSIAASTEASVYSFQYQYRRASQAEGPWQGVNRTRDPAVQTGYTYDVNAFDSEDQDLDPSSDTNVFFLKTLSNNDDILNIDMTTGGVLWKLDYMLRDTYGENISSGKQRSAGEELDLKNNFLYSDGVAYPDRQGTDGFVLDATLNTLLAEATKGARGESNKLTQHMSRATLKDLNLRTNLNGDEFTGGNYTRAATYFQDLVTRLYNAGVSIDPKTGDVKLGWHQLQRHILLCMQAGGGDGIYSGGSLMSEAQCAGFPWCRLDDCAKDITVDIFDLGDIFVAMDKAKDETGDKHPAKDALDKLLTETPSLLDGYYQSTFRKDEDGRKFQNRQEMLDALEKVYDILAAAGLDQDAMKQITAEQVQELLITGTWPTTGKTYWWQNGGKRPVTGWKDFIEGGMLVVSGDVPDALDAMTEENLPNALTELISYAPPTGNETPQNVGWFRKEESEEDDNAFTTLAEFKTAWLKALTTLSAHYDLSDPKTVMDVWETIPWEEIQYALIQPAGDYKTAEEILKEKNYWWKNGGQPRLTYERLMEAADAWRASNYTDSTKLDTLLAKGITPVNNEVYLRRTAAGSGFTSVEQFKTSLELALKVLGFVDNMNDFLSLDGSLRKLPSGEYALDIYQLQYLLINANKLVGQPIPPADKIADPADPDVVCNYWWIPEPHTPTEAQRIGDIMDLLTYAYWARDGVEVDGAMQPLAIDPLGKLDAATLERLKLRAEVHGMPFTDESYADLRARIMEVVRKTGGGLPYKDLDAVASQSAADLTKEVQHLLFPGSSYQTAASITENYWWQGSGFTADTHATLAQAAWLAAVGFDGKTATDAMDQILDLDFITRRPSVTDPGMAMRVNADGAAFTSIEAFKNALLSTLRAAAAADPTLTYDSLTGLTDYQLQYLLLNGVYKTDAEVKAEVIVDGVDAYWWFNADKKPEEEVKKEELFADPAEWDAFLDSAIGYFKKTAGNPAGFVYDLTDEKLKDVLRLRKGPNDSDVITAAEMFSGDKQDLLWQVMTALNTSNRKKEFITGAATNRRWVNKPTWEEFQYVLLHLNDVESGWIMPPTEECAAEKENYGWMWVTGGKVEYEAVRPDATEWGDFMTSAIGYFKKTAGNPAGFVYDLTDDKLKDTLLLRKGPNDSDVIADAEMFSGDKQDLLWQVMTALNTSNRKKEFITGAATNRKWVTPPTWAEFQYVLLHLNDVESGWIMPTTEECEAWATQENAPWVWKEKTTRASLLSLEEAPEDENVPLDDLPDATPVGRGDPVTVEAPGAATLEEPVGPDALIGPEEAPLQTAGTLEDIPDEPTDRKPSVTVTMAGPIIAFLTRRTMK